GVEHEHHRRFPEGTERLRDHPGEPVVRVDDVVLYALGHREEDARAGERWNQFVEPILVQRRGRTDIEVDDPGSRRNLLDRGSVGISLAREDVDGYAGLRNVDGKVANIDVHPAGILAAEGRERAGVHGDHRYPAEQQWIV